MSRAETEGPNRVVLPLDKWLTRALQDIEVRRLNSYERLAVISRLLRKNTILGRRHREVATAVQNVSNSLSELHYKTTVYRTWTFRTLDDFIENWKWVLPMMKDLIDLEANQRAQLLKLTEQASALIHEVDET